MTSGIAAPDAPPIPPGMPVQNNASSGLTSDVASTRLQKDGKNAMPDTSAHPFRNALTKFWAPVPWLLEASIILQVVLPCVAHDREQPAAPVRATESIEGSKCPQVSF